MQYLHAFGAQKRPPAPSEPAQLRLGSLRRESGLRGFCLRQRGHDRGVNHLPEQRFLVREVEIDGALGHLRPLGNVVQARAGEPPFAEFMEGGVEDLGRALFRRSTAVGFYKHHFE